MPIVQLKHSTRLGYASARQLPFLPVEIENLDDSATIISFRSRSNGKPDQTRDNFHACQRLVDLPSANLIFFGIESDSPLAPLILWDAVHTLPVGGTILLAGDMLEESYLERSYYHDSLVVERKDTIGTLLRKVAILPAETNSGLDRWSFCIPVGPEDATLLNVTVKRILELDIQEKEILLCGRPGDNFFYWDKVKIVGEDITAPPIQITRKKNRLAQEARYENLCILHDRVFLPRDFHRAVHDFGDHFPISTFQSFYFDDHWNMRLRRYSDANKLMSSLANKPLGLSRFRSHELSSFSPSVFADLDYAGFTYSNPLRYQRECYYATGSLYLVKRSVWLKCPQNEAIAWGEFEDVEHGYRASQMGIPNRVNPYGLTQSMISRPLLSVAGRVSYEDANGAVRQSANFPWLSYLPLKPLIKLSSAEAYRRQNIFAKKYVTDKTWLLSEQTNPKMSTWLANIGRLVFEAHFPFSKQAVHDFVNDYERLLLLDSLAPSQKKYYEEQIFLNNSKARTNFFENSGELMNHAVQRPAGNLFYNSLRNYLPKRSLKLYIGSFYSACYLWWNNGRVVFSHGGVLRNYRAILSSTPFDSYAEKKE